MLLSSAGGLVVRSVFCGTGFQCSGREKEIPVSIFGWFVFQLLSCGARAPWQGLFSPLLCADAELCS